ncbi:hypothetical protein J2046_005930 [Rhizobium petrolearium]|nr:hypothetical protein [Neorhizobium petrolearium]
MHAQPGTGLLDKPMVHPRIHEKESSYVQKYFVMNRTGFTGDLLG